MEHECLNAARQAVAACWQQAGAALFPIDIDLAEAFAQRLAAWMDTAAQAQRDTAYYRGLLVECAQHLGTAAYTADDGTIHPEPLVAKVPALVRAVVV